MDLGFEGAFICHKNSVPADSGWIDRDIDQNWTLLKKNKFTTVFANDILEEAYLTWNQYMSRFGKDSSIYHLESIVELVKRHGVNHLLDCVGRKEIAADVEQKAAVGILRRIGNLQGRQRAV